MSARRAVIIALWVGALAAALALLLNARYLTDLSAFLPANPTPLQQLLVDQLRDGPASRLILIALEHGDTGERADLAVAMTHRLRRDPAFSNVADGEPMGTARDQELLFQHRYLLSDAVTAGHFSPAGLRAALADTLLDLASSGGLLLKSVVPRDPTGETLRIVDRLAHGGGPNSRDGVWASADGSRTVLLAETAAAGSDTDAQERALGSIRAAFAQAAGPAAALVRLNMSGPGVFAVAARAKIKRAATRLSLISSVLVIGVLLAVYRSAAALILGLLPVASGAVVGIAAVALVFGVVHGITLGFGITLIGESVDYSIYFFIQSRRTSAPLRWERTLWPTIRLGMFTSVCGFATLLPSGFPGLAQLGLYSISGLIAAALVTRFVLPELRPRRLVIRDVSPLGVSLGAWRDAARRRGAVAIAAAAALLASVAAGVIGSHHATLWNRELSALSPISPDQQRYDATLRADLGSADVLDLIVVTGATLEAVLRGAERTGAALQSLIETQVIGSFDSPANYLPSQATQRARRAALPAAAVLEENLRQASAGLNLDAGRLTPFIADVEAARTGGLLTAENLRGTSLAAGFDALILHQTDRWSALLPLHAPASHAALPRIDVARVSAALAAAHLSDAHLLDLKAQTDALYGSYLLEALRLCAAGLVLIVVMLSIALRSMVRVARVLAPLILAVLTVTAGLVLAGEQLTILHLVGMLLIVAVGSNYALFFDAEGRHEAAGGALTLASLAIANVSTVIGFGLLSFSQVPVLEALGTTVAPGAFLALVFAALMTSPAAPLPAVTA